MVEAPSEEIKEPAALGEGGWTPAIHLEQSRRRRTKSRNKKQRVATGRESVSFVLSVFRVFVIGVEQRRTSNPP
jgi:hypothetical protein